MCDSYTVDRRRYFRRVWDMLANEGSCDGAGGSEYQRVRREWFAAGCPFPAWNFIRDRANMGADGLCPSDRQK